MKVRITTENTAYGKRGDVIEVAEHRAQRWIKEGICEDASAKKSGAKGKAEPDPAAEPSEGGKPDEKK